MLDATGSIFHPELQLETISIKEIIDATADIILLDASPDDVRYLLDQEYDPTDKIKTTIQSKINTGDNESEWIKIVIDSEKIWTTREYKEILEDRKSLQDCKN